MSLVVLISEESILKLNIFQYHYHVGITHISKRYAEENNQYMKDYNPNKPTSYIQYLDANNLYG